MIYFLVQVHLEEGVRGDFSVSPPDIPIPKTLVMLNDPPKFLSNFLNYRVLSIADVNYDFLGFESIWQLGYGDVFG